MGIGWIEWIGYDEFIGGDGAPPIPQGDTFLAWSDAGGAQHQLVWDGADGAEEMMSWSD